MNRTRRKELTHIVTMLEELDALREQIRDRLEAVMDEEQEALDNMPESLQDSERGRRMREYIDTMGYVIDDLEQVCIEDVIDQLCGEIIG